MFDRAKGCLLSIVVTPLMLSLSMEKMGDRAKPSNLFISLVDVTKTFRVLIKYQSSGGIVSRMYGNAVMAVTRDPSTINAHERKSNHVFGSRSCSL